MSNCNSIQLNYLRSIPLSHVNVGPSYPIYSKKIPIKTFGGKINLNSNNLEFNKDRNHEPKNNLNKMVLSNRIFNKINLSQVNNMSSKKFNYLSNK